MVTMEMVLNCGILQRVPPLMARLIPFAAVAAANCINIPLVRQRELRYGIPVCDEHHNQLGMSKVRKFVLKIYVNTGY